MGRTTVRVMLSTDERNRFWAMAADSRRAARVLFRHGLYRGAVNRAYYAAYCSVVGCLATEFVVPDRPVGRRNPSHERLPALLIGHLLATERMNARELEEALVRLRLSREDADYAPSANVDGAVALDAVRDAEVVIGGLVPNGR